MTTLTIAVPVAMLGVIALALAMWFAHLRAYWTTMTAEQVIDAFGHAWDHDEAYRTSAAAKAARYSKASMVAILVGAFLVMLCIALLLAHVESGALAGALAPSGS